MTPELPAWSVTLWVAVALLAALMIRGAWRGYRRGPMRQLAGPVALATGQVVGWLFGSDLGHACLQGTSYPWILRGITGVVALSCLTGLLCYALFWRLGRLPEGQKEAESPVMGALVGCWTGMLYFLILIALLATVASVYDLFEKSGETRHHWTVEVRNELAGTPFTAELKEWSPIPDKQRTLIRQTRRLMADPEARRRLMAQPEIRALAAHPTLYQAWEDKKVRELLNNNDLTGFIDHPKVRAVLADEQLQKDAEKVDLPGIIDRSLQKPKK
ncbi:MAG: hypothetical protein RJA95_267 [Verrucomicrobiota bacterium]|jgi:uncharacterized membrane protein required for colicin V production